MSSSAELLIATDKESETAFAQAAASSAGIPLKVCRSAAEAIQNFSDNSILILDRDLVAATAPPNLPFNQVHLLALEEDFRGISRFFGIAPYGHFILRKVPEMAASDGQFYGRVLSKYIRSNVNGLEGSKFKKEQIELIRFSGMIHKKYAATSVGYFLLENGFNEQMSGVVSMAVDELLMNAMIDAPYEGTSTNITNEVFMEVGLDPEALAINVVDAQGSLDRAKLLMHLRTNFSEAANEVRNSGKSGAGLGITQIVRGGGSLLFKVIAGKRTEATVFFRRGKGTREVRRQAQFLSTLRP